MKPTLKQAFTTHDLSKDYHVSDSVIRQLIDRLGLGIRLSKHWRVVFPHELERLEAGLLAMGYKLPVSQEVDRAPENENRVD